MRQIAIISCLLLSGLALFLALRHQAFTASVPGEAYYRQPAFFPLISLALVLAAGFALTVRYATGSRLHEDEELAGTVPHATTLVFITVLFASYIFLVPWTGYLVATILFSIAGLAVARNLNFRYAGSLITLVVLLHLAFSIYMEVWFPSPGILELMN